MKNPREAYLPENFNKRGNLKLARQRANQTTWIGYRRWGQRDLGCNREFLLLRSLDLIILYQIRSRISAQKPDPADYLVVVEVELVVIELVALQCLEVDLVPEKFNNFSAAEVGSRGIAAPMPPT